MKQLSLIVVSLMLLSACAPLAMFASGSSNYDSRLGVQVANDNVNTICLSPALRLAIWEFEGHFRKKVVMTSGFRSPWHNAAVGGASASYHMRCQAADFFIPGVPKQELIRYAMSLNIVGGLGCYPGRQFIHIDVRRRPAGYQRPVTWGC